MRRSRCSIFLSLCLALALTASLAPGAYAEGTYSDVPSGHWAYEEIQQATAAGLFNGYPDGTFGLGRSLTRGEFAVALCRFFGWEPLERETYTFSDCTSGFFPPYVEAAFVNGAVEPAVQYRPDDPITRGEMAEMMVRGLGFAGLAEDASSRAGSSPFSDLSTADPAFGFVLVAYELGMIQGNGDGTFRPDGTATREQVAALLVRTYQRYQAPLSFLHGFYALSSYGNISLTADMDGVSVGWARLEMDGQSGPYLLTERTADNSWAIPDGSQLATDYFAQHGTDCNLNVFTSTYDALALPDGTETSDLGALLDSASYRAQAAELLAEAAADYQGITIDFEGLRDSGGRKEAFVDFMRQLRQALPADKLLYVCVPDPTWHDGYDFRALGEICDKVILMAHDYDFTIPDYFVRQSALSHPNPPAGLTDVYRALLAVTDGETGVADLSKVALAVSIDSSGYQVDSQGNITTTTHYAPGPPTLIQRLRQTDTVHGWSAEEQTPYITYTIEDGSRYTVWYEDARSVSAKIRLAKMLGIDGLSLWYVGSIPTYDDAGLHYNVWEAVQAAR